MSGPVTIRVEHLNGVDTWTGPLVSADLKPNGYLVITEASPGDRSTGPLQPILRRDVAMYARRNWISLSLVYDDTPRAPEYQA